MQIITPSSPTYVGGKGQSVTHPPNSVYKFNYAFSLTWNHVLCSEIEVKSKLV